MRHLDLDGSWQWHRNFWQYTTKKGDVGEVFKTKDGWEGRVVPRNRFHLFSTSLHHLMQAVECFIAARHNLAREVCQG